MRSAWTSLLLWLCAIATAMGTAQIPEVMLWKGDKIYVHNFYLSDDHKMYIGRKIIREIYGTDGSGRIVQSSANWDGFDATLELRDNRLYLLELTIDWPDEGPELIRQEPIPLEDDLFCDWFSGELRQYHPGWWAQQWTRYFVFEQGVLVRVTKEKTRVSTPSRRHGRNVR
jgi:hypothetical protein